MYTFVQRNDLAKSLPMCLCAHQQVFTYILLVLVNVKVPQSQALHLNPQTKS